MLPYIPVAGTWFKEDTGDDRWYRRGSTIDNLFRGFGLERVEQDGDPRTPDPGYWSGDVGGLLFHAGSGQHVWWSGGLELRRFIEGRPRLMNRPMVIVAHSHGGQVAAYALAGLRQIAHVRLITVDMPVRRDMRPVYAEARRNVGYWLHLHTRWGWGARMRVLGSRFGSPTLDIADRNIPLRGGHSGVLRRPQHARQWRDILPHVPNVRRPTTEE